MDEHRIEQALRNGPPDEPVYVPILGQALSAEPEAGVTRPQSDAAFEHRIRRLDGRVEVRGRAGALRVAASLAAVLAIVVAGFAVRFGTEPAASPTPGDLLARIQVAGVVRIAVSNDAPQTAVAGGSFIGFDVDVAKAIAAQLGVRAELQMMSPADILATSGTWDLGLPSRVIFGTEVGAVTGPGYYAWPAWLAVAANSDATTTADLIGQPICVVDGSPAGDWLAGRTVSNTDYPIEPPSGTSIVAAASDAACVTAVTSGNAAAVVTAALLDTELGGRDMRALVADPVIIEHRVVLIRDRGLASDLVSFEAAVNAAITELRTSGQLAELSRSAFGGRDLTDVAP